MRVIQDLQVLADKLVNTFTLGQLVAIRQMYVSFISTAPTVKPDIVSYFFSLFFVIIKFLVPIIFVSVILQKVTKNIYLILGGIGLTAILYSYLYFNPITTFYHLAQSIQNFRLFILNLDKIKAKPFIFTFLNNGLYVFIFRLIVSVIGIFVMFALVLGLSSIIILIMSGGKNPWSYTNKQFKLVCLQLTIVFLIFWAIFGSFKAFIMTTTLLLGSVSLISGLRTMMGYEKYCFTRPDGEVECRWIKR